jgi:WD40 repeat protein
MPSCRLYDLSSHEVGDVVLLTPRQPGFSHEFTYMHCDVGALLLALSPDGSRISSFGYGFFSIGNTISGEMRDLASRIKSPGTIAIGFSADGHRLLAADGHCHIHAIDVENVDSDWVDLPPAEEVDGSMTAIHATFSHDGVYCAFNVESTDRSNTTKPQPVYYFFLRRVQADAQLHLLHDPCIETHADKVVFTPNTQYLVQSSSSSIAVWNVDQRTLHAQRSIGDFRPVELETYITGLAAISNILCALLVSDGAVYIWNVDDGSLLRKLDGYTSSDLDHPRSKTRLLAISTPSSQSLLGLVIDSTVKLLDVTAEDPIIAQHSFHMDSRCNIILDGLKSRIYLKENDNQLVCWNYKLAPTPEAGRVDSSGTVEFTVFSNDGSLLVSGSQDGSMTVWQALTGRRIAKHTGQGVVLKAAFSLPSARFILSTKMQADDVAGSHLLKCRTLELIDASTGETKTAWQIKPCPEANQRALSQNGERLALHLTTDSFIDGLYLLDVHSGKIIARVHDTRDDWGVPTEVLFTQDSHSLVERYEKSILIRDAQTLEIRHTISYSGLVKGPLSILTLILSPRSSHVGLVYQDGCHLCFQAWNIQSGVLEINGAHIQVLEESSYFGIWPCIWTPKYLIYASRWDHSVATWNFDDNTPATVHEWPKAWKVEQMCVSQDKSYLYAWCGDQRIRAWTTTDFDTTRPILELETSEWMERLPLGWKLHQRSLICALHDATRFQAVFRVQETCYFLTVDLASGSCVSMTYLGEHQLINGANISFIDNRLYTYVFTSGYDTSDLLWHLVRAPIGDDDDAAEWAQTIGDVFEVLQRTLLQVWSLETGEMEAIITWTEDNIQLESVPLSTPLRLPCGQYGQNARLNVDNHVSLIRIYSTLSSRTHVCSIGLSPDRRLSGSAAVHDRLVAVGSTHGTVSIFDVTKAVEIAEAKQKLEQESST